MYLIQQFLRLILIISVNYDKYTFVVIDKISNFKYIYIYIFRESIKYRI